MTSTEDCRATVVNFVNAIVDQRLDDARTLLHDEFVIHAAGGVPYSGEYHGPEGLFQLLAKIFELLEPTLGPIQYLVDNDQEKRRHERDRGVFGSRRTDRGSRRVL